MAFEESASVIVENVSYFYEEHKIRNRVLKDLSISCFPSQIVAIVGPSGCGKTTLVKLIASLLPIQNGNIYLFGHDASKWNNRLMVGVPGPGLGYMPQEDALPRDFRVSECLYFFGILNSMRCSEIAERADKILKELRLIDDKNEFVANLSGGKHRRLSLGIAILHSPHLLILDEPTAGADPELRNSIWTLLNGIKQQATIIITTHYIEECKNVEQVCFMRKGRIQNTGSPSELIQKSNSTNLRQVYEKLYLDSDFKNLPVLLTVQDIHQPGTNSTKKWSFSTEILKVCLLIYRYFHFSIFNPTLLLILIGLPTFNIMSVYWIFSDKLNHIPIGLVVEKQTLFLDEFLLQNLNQTPTSLEFINPQNFKNYLDPIIFAVSDYETLESAMHDVSNHKIYAVIYINGRFGDSFLANLVLGWSKILDMDLPHARIMINADSVNKHVFRFIENYANQAYNDYWEASRSYLGLGSTLSFPIKVEHSPIRKSKAKKLDETDWQMVGHLSASMYPSSIVIAGIGLVLELKDKCVERYRAAGISSRSIYLAQILANLLCIGLSAILGTLSVIFFVGTGCQGSLILVFFFILLQVLLNILIAHLLAVLFMSEIVVLIFGILTIYGVIGCEGALISAKGYPYYITSLTELLPHSKAHQTLRSLIIYGHRIDHPDVYMGIVVTLVYICFLYPLINCILNQKINHK